MFNFDVTSIEVAIFSAMHKEFGGPKLFVTCKLLENNLKNQTFNQQSNNKQQSMIKFITNGDAYCSHGNEKLWCIVIALLA